MNLVFHRAILVLQQIASYIATASSSRFARQFVVAGGATDAPPSDCYDLPFQIHIHQSNSRVLAIMNSWLLCLQERLEVAKEKPAFCLVHMFSDIPRTPGLLFSEEQLFFEYGVPATSGMREFPVRAMM